MLSLVRLITLFAISVSMITLAGLSGEARLPFLSPVRANPQGADEPWYPSGPEMNTLFVPIYTDQTAEFNNGLESGTVDFVDAPPSPTLLSSMFNQNPGYLVTQPKSSGFSEIEFNLASNFWGCPFNFGNSACGVDIRQGIAHLIDKSIFANNDPNIATQANPIDNPLTPSSLLPSPSPCNWDSAFPESGSSCIVGAPGGTADHLATATGACVVPPLGGFCSTVSWMQGNPSPDFCAAAQDIATGVNLVIPPGNGYANQLYLQSPPSGFPTGPPSSWTFNSSTNCQLQMRGDTGTISNIIGNNPVTFYVRNDNPTLQDLGQSYAEAICAVWSGSFTNGCHYVPVPMRPLNPMDVLDVSEVNGNLFAFPGYYTSTGSAPTTIWGMWTAGPGSFVPANPFDGERERLGELTGGVCQKTSCDPFDSELYFTFNSRFVSGIPSIQPPTQGATCSAQATPTHAASNYMYLCYPAYDSLSSQMEFSPCLSSPNDPSNGSSSDYPGGDCVGTTQLSAISAGIQAEDLFGQGAYAIPVYSTVLQYAFLNNGWSRVINAEGTFNYFTWLNAWNPAPVQTGTIREGMAESTTSLNPYIASSSRDLAILGSVYDSLLVVDPYSLSLVDWMTENTVQLQDNQLIYAPPPGTVTTYRFTLRQDIFFQDGYGVTAFDVAFSYLTLLSTGSLLGTVLEPLTGITILSDHQFDLNLNAAGPFTLASITSLPILPGHWWTSLPSSWDSYYANCTGAQASCYPAQYTLSGLIVNCTLNCTFGNDAMQVDPTKIAATYDPIAHHIFVGSGPWQCGTVTRKTGSGTCSSTGDMNPPADGAYTLTRFGYGLAPASSLSGIYFRSSGDLALYLWSVQNDVNPLLAFVAVASCYQVAVNLAGACGHFQQGIGNSGSGTSVGVGQISVSSRFYNLNWVAPFEWATNPPPDIGALPPVLYEGSVTLNPASVAGCPGGYDC